MIRSRISTTQRRIAFPRDAALFVYSLRPTARLGATLFIAATCLSGCTLSGASITPQERTSSTRWPAKTASASTQPATAKPATAKPATAKPATAKAAPINAATGNTSKKSTSPLQAWANALFHGAKKQTRTAAVSKSASSAPTLVYIDVLALAQRHPVWRLAEQLAASQPATVDVAFPGAMPRAGEVDLQPLSRASLSRASLSRASLSRVPFADNRVLDATAPGVTSASRSVALTSKTVGAARRSVEEAFWQNGARRQSAIGLNQFLQAARADQKSARRAQHEEGHATLEDDLTSREIVLPMIEPIGLPPAVQLEITNLRLKLLPNANTPALERAKAQAQLSNLQAMWKDKLRAQEEQLLQEWARQRDEEPLRLRREGEAQIAAQMQRAKNVDEARLTQLRNEQQRFLASDFSSRDTFALALPPFSVYRVRGALMPSAAKVSPHLAPRIRWPEMAPVGERIVQSALKSGSASVSLGAKATRAKALRAQALQDARGWAQTVARSRGWHLTEKAEPGAIDETRFALKNLGLL